MVISCCHYSKLELAIANRCISSKPLRMGDYCEMFIQSFICDPLAFANNKKNISSRFPTNLEE